MRDFRLSPSDPKPSFQPHIILHPSVHSGCTPVFLPGESQGQGSLVGCHLWGHTELGPRPARGAGTLIPSAQRLVWAAKQPLGNAALGALFACQRALLAGGPALLPEPPRVLMRKTVAGREPGSTTRRHRVQSRTRHGSGPGGASREVKRLSQLQKLYNFLPPQFY